VRIFAVTPIHVPAEELTRRQARYDALCPPGVSVVLQDIGSAAPRALDTEQQVRDSEGLVTAALQQAPDEADALMPDCVLDPGVPALAGRAGSASAANTPDPLFGSAGSCGATGAPGTAATAAAAAPRGRERMEHS